MTCSQNSYFKRSGKKQLINLHSTVYSYLILQVIYIKYLYMQTRRRARRLNLILEQ